MTWINSIIGKIKFLIVGLLDIVRYLCCSSRGKQKTESNFAPLSSIGIVGKNDHLLISNEDMNFVSLNSNNFGQQRNVQDHIAQYRQQKSRQLMKDADEEGPANFFLDMEPKIMRQQKLVLKNKEESLPKDGNSRLCLSPEVNSSELAAWEEMENTGNWDVGEETADELLKEKKRIERERRLVENMKKRMDKDRNRIASKIS